MATTPRSTVRRSRAAGTTAPAASVEAPPRPVARARKRVAAAPVDVQVGSPERKTARPKLVRDSFRMPKAEHALLDQLKERCAASGRKARKSELLRAGLLALVAMNDRALRAALEALPAIPPRRPAKA